MMVLGWSRFRIVSLLSLVFTLVGIWLSGVDADGLWTRGLGVRGTCFIGRVWLVWFVWNGLFVEDGLVFGFCSYCILVGDGGDISTVRSVLVEEYLTLNWVFLEGFGAKWDLFFAKGGVWISWELGRGEEGSWELERERLVEILPLNAFITFSFTCSTMVVE